MSTQNTPGFQPTDGNAADPQIIGDGATQQKHQETQRKLENLKIDAIEFDQEDLEKRLQNLVNREYPQQYPLKSQVPESFTTEFIMKPIDTTDIHK